MRRLFAALLAIGLVGACGAPAGPGASPAATPSATSQQTPTPSPSPTPSSAPTPAPSPSPAAPAGFVCGTGAGGSAAASAVNTVRAGQHAGYDRFVIEFAGGVPAYTVAPQAGTTFTRSPRGDQVTLEGESGVLITVHPVSNWTSYGGPAAFLPRYPYLRQAVLIENYEGYQQWALGVNGSAACVRVAVYASPSRLVVDVVGV